MATVWADLRIKVPAEVHAAISVLADHEGLTIDKWIRARLAGVVDDQLRLARSLIGLTPAEGGTAPARTVYFVRAGNEGDIKIGQTTDIQGRMKALQTGVPHQLLLLASAPETESVSEGVLHQRFAHLRKRGEWFEPAPDLLAAIAEIAAQGDEAA